MEQKVKVLLVEDDESLGFLISEFLSSRNFNLTLCSDGKAGWESFQSEQYQFVILDIMLPEIDGYTLAGKIKERAPKVPVIFLTARSMKADKIKGFNLGVDDYITKPFDEDELLCRIYAILNRTDAGIGPGQEQIKIGAYLYQHENQTLQYNGQLKRLTVRENEVLRLLVQNSGQVVKREVILNRIWGNNDYFSGRSLDVYISKLRKYLQSDPSVLIENIPKVGFIFKSNS